MELFLIIGIVFLFCLFLSIRRSQQPEAPVISINRKDWQRGKPLIVRGDETPRGIFVVPKILSESDFEAVKKNLIKQDNRNRQKPLVVLGK